MANEGDLISLTELTSDVPLTILRNHSFSITRNRRNIPLQL